LHYLQQNFIQRVSNCTFTGAKVMILNRKFLKFEIDLDFVLIAVTTSLKDYRICYLINKYLNFNFTKTEDLEAEVNAGEPLATFSQYQYNPKSARSTFYFIANKGSDGYLLPEMRKADYFLMTKNNIDENELDNLVSSLNKVAEIVAAVKIDPKKIKSREKSLILAQIFEV
jgi:hypothetical protein